MLVASNMFCGHIITDSTRFLSTRYFLIADSLFVVFKTLQGSKNTALPSIIESAVRINAKFAFPSGGTSHSQNRGCICANGGISHFTLYGGFDIKDIPSSSAV